jgi:hypothetical protein
MKLVPGLLTLGALAVGLGAVIRPGPLAGTWAAVTLAAWTTVVVALGVTQFGDVWPYAPLAHVPGIGGIREIARVVLVLLFPAGVVLAGCVDALCGAAGRAGKGPAVLVGVLALALVVADHWLAAPEGARAQEWAQTRYPLEHILTRQKLISDAIRRHPAPTLVYVFPSVADQKRLNVLVVQLEAMRAAQDLGLPTVNGWSGYIPHEWAYFTGYRSLMEWLTVQHHLPEGVLAGLVVVGEPAPDADPQYEAAMRARFPPQPVGK